MATEVSFHNITRVLDTWELARQKYGSEEELGIEILIRLCRAAPDAKTVFGFQPKHDVERNPMLRMGAMVHGLKIVKMLDGAIALLGPDMDLLQEILGQLGERHRRHGVKKEHFAVLGDVVRESIAEIIGDEYTEQHDEAWNEVFRLMSSEITKSMD